MSQGLVISVYEEFFVLTCIGPLISVDHQKKPIMAVQTVSWMVSSGFCTSLIIIYHMQNYRYQGSEGSLLDMMTILDVLGNTEMALQMP